MPIPFTPFIDTVWSQLQSSLPKNALKGFEELRGDFEQNLRCAIEANLQKLDLVTRHEFDIQQQVLTRTREKLEQLEKRVTELEAMSNK